MAKWKEPALIDVRTWFHYPIEMPLTAGGQGPATVGNDAASISYEVWDQALSTHGSFDNLPDAINEAMRMNGAIADDDLTVAYLAGAKDYKARAVAAELAARYEGDLAQQALEARAKLATEVARLRDALQQINVGDGWAARIARVALSEGTDT